MDAITMGLSSLFMKPADVTILSLLMKDSNFLSFEVKTILTMSMKRFRVLKVLVFSYHRIVLFRGFIIQCFSY